MGKITVYQFWYYNGFTEESIRSPTKRTAAEIERMGYKPILETAEEIDSSELDEHGRYCLSKSKVEKANRT